MTIARAHVRQGGLGRVAARALRQGLSLPCAPGCADALLLLLLLLRRSYSGPCVGQVDVSSAPMKQLQAWERHCQAEFPCQVRTVTRFIAVLGST